MHVFLCGRIIGRHNTYSLPFCFGKIKKKSDYIISQKFCICLYVFCACQIKMESVKIVFRDKTSIVNETQRIPNSCLFSETLCVVGEHVYSKRDLWRLYLRCKNLKFVGSSLISTKWIIFSPQTAIPPWKLMHIQDVLSLTRRDNFNILLQYLKALVCTVD